MIHKVVITLGFSSPEPYVVPEYIIDKFMDISGGSYRLSEFIDWVDELPDPADDDLLIFESLRYTVAEQRIEKIKRLDKQWATPHQVTATYWETL